VRSFAWAAATTPPLAWTVQHRRSEAVRNWSPPGLPGRKLGALHARTGGDGRRGVLLLHGLVSTGDVFGAAYESLAATRRLVIPDLLGFGRSLDTTRSSFSPDDHLDALDELADRTGLLEGPLTLGAHSMGAAVALRWAARHPGRVDRIVCWGAPIHPSPEAARSRLSGNVMVRLFALDTNLAQKACAANCRHRTAAGWMAAALDPKLPVSLTRAASLHTWPAYHDAMVGLVIETDWGRLLDELDDAEIDIDLVWGSDDTVSDPDHVATITRGRTHAHVTVVPEADHHLPVSHPALCRDSLTTPRDRR
jgi:pimeloyl-ACP methyl ester carboxylesterase